MYPPVFDDIHSILKTNLNEEHDFKVEKDDRSDSFYINVVDEPNNIIVKITFIDETKGWNIHEVKEIQELSDISYCISAEYITEGIDPGYFRNRSFGEDLDLVCYNIYEEVLDLRKEMVKDREENIERTKEVFEEAEPISPERKFEIELAMRSGSEEEFSILSGNMNKTTLN